MWIIINSTIIIIIIASNLHFKMLVIVDDFKAQSKYKFVQYFTPQGCELTEVSVQWTLGPVQWKTKAPESPQRPVRSTPLRGESHRSGVRLHPSPGARLSCLEVSAESASCCSYSSETTSEGSQRL